MEYQDTYSEHALTNWQGVFTDIFNLSLSESVIPTCFKQTTIVPVPKNTMVVCLKHVGIRLGQGEVENVSEDTCQLVSACSQYTSWYSIWPCGLVNVDLFKGLTHIGCGERDHTVFRKQLVLSCMFQCYFPQREHRSSLARLVGSCHWAALGCASLCSL